VKSISEFRALCLDAASCSTVLDYDDAYLIVRGIIDRVIERLIGTRATNLSRYDIELLLAPVQTRCTEDVGQMISGAGDVDAFINAIVNELRADALREPVAAEAAT
jgi:hypothetical protein